MFDTPQMSTINTVMVSCANHGAGYSNIMGVWLQQQQGDLSPASSFFPPQIDPGGDPSKTFVSPDYSEPIAS